ncbi:MAG: ATP-binding cassette domain-containing protein [Candidatus Coproplasma sp.]
MIDKSLFKHFKAIGDIKSAIAGAANVEDALRECVHIIRNVSNAETAVIWYYDKIGDKKLHPIFAQGEHTFIEKTLSPGEDIVGKVFAESNAVYLPEGKPDENINSLICVPLENSYETLGCIQFINRKDGTQFTEDDANVCEIMAMLAATAIDESGLDVGVIEQKDVILSLRGVVKDFKNGDTVTHVLRGVDLDVYEGELLVILGESGCGKSTMLNIIGGMDQLTEGEFRFYGEDYSHATEKVLTEYRRNNIGFIFQSYNLMPNLTAIQNLRFIAELKKDSDDPEKMLELVGLSERRNNYPSQMSGGQQQRVSIARALVKKPKLILADEPTAALDYATGIEVLSIIEKVAAAGTSILMVTHNEEITKMANRVIRMRGGIIEEVYVNRHPLKATDLVW